MMFAYLTFQSMTIVFTMNQRWSSLPISMNWVYAVLPVGFALSSLRSFQMCIIGAKTNIQNIEMIADEFVTAEKKNLSCDTVYVRTKRKLLGNSVACFYTGRNLFRRGYTDRGRIDWRNLFCSGWYVYLQNTVIERSNSGLH